MMMAARVTQIPPYRTPCLYSPSTTFSSTFHVNQFPASGLWFSHFQSSALETKKQGTHSGLSTLRSQKLFHSSKYIWRIFVKFLESQRQLPGKLQVQALLPQTNLGLGLANIFAGSVVHVVYTPYSDQIREKCLLSTLAIGAIPDVESKENLVTRQGGIRAIEPILKPQGDYAYYSIIVGKHGTGKTTLVRQVGHQLDGILYLNISPNSVSNEAFA
ncbi:hypothetical protein HOY82DRAFT_611720 [Tuber indicum]|nr:hypothetical protein HOY82DRAFT_611720 [Tuber indicum]